MQFIYVRHVFICKTSIIQGCDSPNTQGREQLHSWDAHGSCSLSVILFIIMLYETYYLIYMSFVLYV